MGKRLKTLLKNGYLVDPNAFDVPKEPIDILMEDGIIRALGRGLPDEGAQVFDCQGLYLMPGAVDAHTHIGYGSDRDLETETKNAVSGGVTTLITYHRKAENYLETVPAFIEKISREAYCNVGIHLGLSTYEQTGQLETYVRDFGIPSFKYFTNYIGAAGVKAGVEIVSDANLIEWMTRIARLGGTICIHAENQDIIEKRTAAVKEKNEDSLKGWYEARPPVCEAEAILRCAYFAAKTGCRFYAVHVTCKESLEVLRMMKRQYPAAQIIVETCPHYLTHTYESDWGNVGKVNPPLRTQADVDALWEAIEDGLISVVASDHVARPLSKKEGSVFSVNAGFPGCATLLPVLLHEGFHKRGISLNRIAQLVSRNPAEIFGLPGRRGNLAVGAAADVTVFDLSEKKKTPVEFSNADYNLYQNQTMQGWPVYTFVGGCEVRGGLYREENPAPHGVYLRRTAK